MEIFEFVKENKKSSIYESATYTMKISDSSKYFFKKNGSDYTEYDDSLQEGGYKFVTAFEVTFKNKSTGKEARKRCYQPFGEIIEDVQRDLNGTRQQFRDVWAKID